MGNATHRFPQRDTVDATMFAAKRTFSDKEQFLVQFCVSGFGAWRIPQYPAAQSVQDAAEQVSKLIVVHSDIDWRVAALNPVAGTSRDITGEVAAHVRPVDYTDPCSTCNGRGFITYEHKFSHNRMGSMTEACPSCEGQGFPSHALLGSIHRKAAQ